MRKTISGFTIVELLIVIVVIGIISAIAIVGYNGVQDNAKNASNTTAVTHFLDFLRIYSSDTGKLPFPTDVQNMKLKDSVVVCLGRPEDYPKIQTLDAGVCSDGLGTTFDYFGNRFETSSQLNNLIEKYSSKNSNVYAISTDAPRDYHFRGVMYVSRNYGEYGELDYFLFNRNAKCLKGFDQNAGYFENAVKCTKGLNPKSDNN